MGNESGQKAELWTDTPSEVIFKGLLDHSESLTVNVKIGETYWFTNEDSGGSKEHKLYAKVIRSNTKKVTLYDKQGMREAKKKNDVGCDDKGKCTVILENRYGKTLYIFWQGADEAVAQGSLKNKDDMTLFTHLGHQFFVTEENKPDSKQVFTIKIKKKTKVVKLSSSGKKEL